MLAISGVSLMLAVTRSAAPAPPNGWVVVQRTCIAAGAIGIAVRRGVERRFDVAVAAFVAGLVAGTAGGVRGVVMAIGAPSTALRSVHATLNLLGLVGLVVGGTMPVFATTVVRARMSPPASANRMALILGWRVAMLVLASAALAADREVWVAIGLGGYALGLVAVFDGCWEAVLVIAWYAQIAWGSLAYLPPMLRDGGHERLGEGVATTRSWPGLASANIAGVALTTSWMPVAAVSLTMWMLDSAWRAARVGTTEFVRPDQGAT